MPCVWGVIMQALSLVLCLTFICVYRCALVIAIWWPVVVISVLAIVWASAASVAIAIAIAISAAFSLGCIP